MDRSPPTAMTVIARLATDAATARRLADVLAEMLDASEAAVAAVEGIDGQWSVEVHFEHAPNEAALRALVAELADAQAARALTFARITPRDWVKRSLAGLTPVPAGRFVVHGAHDRARVPSHRIGIEIEAALAFGTGHHGTTRGCLLALDRLLKRNMKGRQRGSLYLRLKGRGRQAKRARWRSNRNRRMKKVGARPKILDIGTGAGVLAIAAAKALRCRVLATDIDARAVDVARDNAHANQAGAWIEVVHAAGVASRRLRGRAPFDFVFANILLEPLKLLAAPMARLIAPGARVILSGLLASQANAVLAAYRAQGLALESRILLEGWVTVVLRR